MLWYGYEYGYSWVCFTHTTGTKPGKKDEMHRTREMNSFEPLLLFMPSYVRRMVYEARKRDARLAAVVFRYYFCFIIGKEKQQQKKHFFRNDTHGARFSRVCVSNILAVTSARMCAVQTQASSTLYAATHSNMHSPTTTNSITNSRHPKLLSTSINIHTDEWSHAHMHSRIRPAHGTIQNESNKAIDRCRTH